jgi:uncharacterized protein (DUF433 family)
MRGESREGIAESFPALTLEGVLGSLAFYLAHRVKIDDYLQEGKQEFEQLRAQAHRSKRLS